MEAVSATYDIIRNRACIVCGAHFGTPRVGKLYCSVRCKQFSYYHKSDIQDHFRKERAKDNAPAILELSGYRQYCRLYDRLQEYKKLVNRSNSKYLTMDDDAVKRLEYLEQSIPDYAKTINLPKLTLEEWSFVTLRFHNKKMKYFLKIVASLNQEFYRVLSYTDDQKIKGSNYIFQSIYRRHIEDILAGNIKFV